MHARMRAGSARADERTPSWHESLPSTRTLRGPAQLVPEGRAGLLCCMNDEGRLSGARLAAAVPLFPLSVPLFPVGPDLLREQHDEALERQRRRAGPREERGV